MSEIWFRGEGVGVAPAHSGSTAPHDIGDGMYLTDNPDAAKAYSELRASDPSQRRVYSVKIKRSSLRILDLTVDPRWQKHVAPVEDLLRTGRMNENYGRTFESFLRTHKIDLNQYDAVIGHDYVRGGKQMSILYKQGKLTRLHVSIRKAFQLWKAPAAPAIPRTRTWVPEINIKTRPVSVRGGMGMMRTVGGFALTIGLQFILSAIRSWLDRKQMNNEIEAGMAKIQTEIDQRVTKLKPEIAKLQLQLDPGEKVFANVVVQVHYVKYSVGIPGRGNYTKPDVVLADVNVTTRNVSSERSYEKELPGQHGRMVNRPIDESTRSFEVEVYTPRELEFFQELSTEYLDYKRKLGLDSTNEVFIEEARRVRGQIVKSFGEDVWFLKP